MLCFSPLLFHRSKGIVRSLARKRTKLLHHRWGFFIRFRKAIQLSYSYCWIVEIILFFLSHFSFPYFLSISFITWSTCISLTLQRQFQSYRYNEDHEAEVGDLRMTIEVGWISAKRELYCERKMPRCLICLMNVANTQKTPKVQDHGSWPVPLSEYWRWPSRSCECPQREVALTARRSNQPNAVVWSAGWTPSQTFRRRCLKALVTNSLPNTLHGRFVTKSSVFVFTLKPRAKLRPCLDPTPEEMKKQCLALRRNAKVGFR